MLLHSNLQVPPESLEPDVYRVEPKKPTSDYPDPEFVISRNPDGSIVSKYSDNFWDLSPYSTTSRGPRIIYFVPKKASSSFNTRFVDDFKWMMFVILYFANRGPRGRIGVAAASDYANCIKKIIHYCKKAEISLVSFFESNEHLTKYIKSISVNRQLIYLSSLLTQLFSVDPAISRINISNSNFLELLKQQIIKSKNLRQQTPVIPSRIYSKLITNCNEWVTDFTSNSKSITDFIVAIDKNKNLGREIKSQYRNGLNASTCLPNFKLAAESYSLTNYFDKYQVTNVANFSRHLRKVQNACKYLIHIFSGMRDDEALSLKATCLKVQPADPVGKTYLIFGTTSKLTGIKKKERWISSKDVEPAINAAKLITMTIAKCRGYKTSDLRLFTSVGLLSFSPRKNFDRKESQAGFHDLNSAMFNIPILKDDHDELKRLCPFTDWDAQDKFRIGAPWPIRTHQLRRSLAIYTAQSGLVSLPTLKRQLKHLSREMSIYYARGASLAKNLFSDSPYHFRKEYLKAKPEADSLAYIYKLLLSDEKLFGRAGRKIEQLDQSSNAVTILSSKTVTLKSFYNGEIAYSETPLGACLASGPCEKRAMRSITACINCEKAVIKKSKLERVIKSQQFLVESLDRSSLEYRMEVEQLNDLSRLRKRMKRST